MDEGKTYRGVDGLEALEVGVLAQPVVGAAEDDAGKAPAKKAGVDGREAAKERVEPRLRALGRLGVDVLAGAGHYVVEPRRPLGHVVVADGALLGGLLLLRGGHCVCWLLWLVLIKGGK